MSENYHSRNKKRALAASAVLLAVVGVLVLFEGPAKARWSSISAKLMGLFKPLTGKPAPSVDAGAGERKILYYHDPMHPAYRSDKPGIAPDCGMQLVPVYAPEGGVAIEPAPATQGSVVDRGPVQISPAQRQLMGLATARAEYRRLEKTIRTVGRVDIDETRVARVHTRISGWIQKVFVDYTWQHVNRGDPLFTIYSPDLVATQQEYLLALKGKRSLGASSFQEVAAGADSLLEASRRRLMLWDVSEDQIGELERTGQVKREVVLYSPITGHVTDRQAFPNKYVTPEMALYTVVDHSRVWVYADIYEPEIGLVRLGQDAAVTVDAYPGQVFPGKVSYLWPHLDMQTRTLKVRMEFPNPDLKLKPEMYARVDLKIALGRRLVVPDSAVFDSGARQLVFVETAPGRFEPRDVTLGVRSDGYAEVLQGLKPREAVASSATFLIDSESQLRAALAGMTLGTVVTEIAGRPAPEGEPSAPEVSRLQIDFRTEPDPPRTGKNGVRVTVRDAAGKPVDGLTVKVVFFMPAMPSMGMAATRTEAGLSSIGAGHYRGDIEVRMPGTWQVTVTVEKKGKTVEAAPFTVMAK